MKQFRRYRWIIITAITIITTIITYKRSQIKYIRVFSISNKTSKASLRVCTHEKPFTIEESRNPSPPPPYIQYMRYNTHARVTRWAQSWLNNGDRIIEGRPSVRLIQLDIPVYTGFILENLIEFEGVAATQPDYHRINTLPLPNVGFIVRQM